MINYRKLIEILVGSMQIEVADLMLAKATWQAFVLKQIEAWASVIIAKERISIFQAHTQMFEDFEDISVEMPETAADHLTNAFYNNLGTILNRM